MKDDEPIPGLDATESRKDLVTRVLRDWWMSRAQYEVDKTVDKAVQYGSVSLQIVGDALSQQIPKPKRSQSLSLQMACAMYAFGKLARIWGACLRGDQPQEDDWFDLGVYARMGQHIHEKGHWT